MGAFEDSFRDRDIVFYSETHQAPGQSAMPQVMGYRWETVCRTNTDLHMGAGDLGGSSPIQGGASATFTDCSQRCGSQIHVGEIEG